MNQSTQGNFQKIFMIGGFVLGVVGIFVFSISQFGNNNVDPNLTGDILVWGTLPGEKISQIFYEYSQNAKTYSVTYVEIPEDKFINRFIEANANESGPDILIVPENISVPLKGFLSIYDQNIISEKTYKDMYARSTYKFFAPTGVFAFPIAIDPLIMYVNTDILTNAGFSKAPTTWGDLPLYVSRVLGFTTTDGNNVQRAIAMGSLNNILHNREVLLTLLMQLKNDVIVRNFVEKQEKDGIFYEEIFESVFGSANEELKIKNDVLAEQVFVFFTSFVNPNIKEAYTWSKKAPMDRDLFASGNLGLYFGLASDKAYIDSRNPNLAYEVAMIPSPKGPTSEFRNTGYAKLYSAGMYRRTKKLELSYKVIQDIASKEITDKIVSAYNLAPARQDELYKDVLDENKEVVGKEVNELAKTQDIIYRSAERGDIIMEPIPNLVTTVFGEIVDAISGSRQTPSEIIKNAEAEFARALK